MNTDSSGLNSALFSILGDSFQLYSLGLPSGDVRQSVSFRVRIA